MFLSTVREKLDSGIVKLGNAISVTTAKNAALATAVSSVALFSSNVMAVDAQGLFGTIIKILGALLIALALFLAVMGIVHYAAANADGDGPAKNKAVQQIAAGGMVLVVSIVLLAQSDNLASYIANASSEV